ncbi:CCHC-type domain-containing protein [Trichonephila clavipes]|nr:CCHC-type domain-containing protein [Trichonephila clavipes]
MARILEKFAQPCFKPSWQSVGLNFDDVGTEEEIRRPNCSRRFTPSPTRGRSPIRRYRSPSPYRRSSQSPGRGAPGEDPLKWLKDGMSTKPTETRPRPTYAAVTRKYRAPVQKFPPEPRKTDVWRTADNRPVCFHCGRPGHVMRYCRERKAVFDNSRNRRRNFDDVGTEEEIRRPNCSRRFTPSPTRGRSPIRRYRSPSPYRRSSQSPGRRSEEN